MAIVNIALVKAWVGELDDGVLWARGGDNVVVADDIAPGFAGDRAGVRIGDTLASIDGQDVRAVADVATMLHAADGTQGLLYVVKRAGTELNLLVQLQPMPTVNGSAVLLAGARRDSVDRRSARPCGCGGRTIRRRCTSSG